MSNIQNIGELVAKQADQFGSSVFLHDKHSSFSFLENQEITNNIASNFMRLGLQKGERVAIFLPNRVEYAFAFFATLKAGGVVVPINPNASKDEIAFILQNSEAKFLVCPLYGQRLKEASSFLETIFCTRGNHGDIENAIDFEELYQSDGFEAPEILPDDIAGIIYTSGTMAIPKKGVMLTHKNYLFASETLSKSLKMSSEDRFLSTLPLHHINGQVVGILNMLQAGGQVILSDSLPPIEFLQILEKYKITAFRGAPFTFTILNRQPNISQYDLTHLKTCICSFAPMSAGVFREFEQKFEAKILEGYGLTEGTSISTINPADGERKIGSVGLPLDGHGVRIVNTKTGKSLSPNKIGRIVVSGENVMKSYFNNSEETANRLINGELHTGDLGYFDEDGYLFISGRIKNIISRGEETIYPKEVEKELLKHENILSVAVVGLPDDVWGEEITAVIIPRAGRTITKEEIIIYCRKQLADYMCPRNVIFRETLPKTSAGKILKQKLTEMLIEEFSR